jgi:thiosulfate/3-mercaptopyruvate sulfurtransferase
MKNYANAHALADVGWLAENLGNPAVRVIDARFDVRPTPAGALQFVSGRGAYAEGHVPGAVFVDLTADLADPDEPMCILSPERFEALAARLGIANDTTVVVYDDRGGLWAGRVWWALRYYGHEDVKLLDGGLAHWRAAGLPLEVDIPTPAPARFRARPRSELRATRDDVHRAIGQPDVCIVDALPEAFFTGEARLYPSHRAGHVPGALNVPAPSHLDASTQAVLPPDALERLWGKLELERRKQVITYCGGGVFAAFALFALYLQGHEHVALYDASWMEWGADPSLPVETGAEAAGPGPDAKE